MPFSARRFIHRVNTRSADRDAEERAWVERIRAGDEAAFEALFSAYYPSLCEFVHGYLRAPDVAEEIVQNVFLRAWERRAEWHLTGSVGAYLFSACRNRALDHMKHERVITRVSGEAVRDNRSPGFGQPPPQPDDEAVAAQLADALREVVHQLPERRRLVFVLRWQHGLTHAEIGHVLGISAKGAETQFARAMADLRGRLARFRA